MNEIVFRHVAPEKRCYLYMENRPWDTKTPLSHRANCQDLGIKPKRGFEQHDKMIAGISSE